MGHRTWLLLLNPSEKQMLERAVHRHENWRVRERAQTLLLLSQGWKCDAVAEHLGLCAAPPCAVRAGVGGMRDF
jgi:hypothetical protein